MPCGQDLFKGNSHSLVAQNIANIIANNRAKIIGIDGGWGAGKSNMVKLVKDILFKIDSKKYHFFIYDAWGHQTDFQRRSILENLTSFLVDEEKLLNKKVWNARLLQLLSRKRTVGTKVVKELSAVVKVSAVNAFLMPFLVFFSGMIDDSLIKLVYWGLIFVLSLVLLFYLQVKNMKKYGQSISISNFMHELFLSYMDYTNEKSKDAVEQSIKYETIYDEEPSTRGFKNWMKDIDKDIKDHKLVIVFDNMDRLPREKVQELWAAIHTFFAEEKYDNINVIVPFDREHIKTAFKPEDIITNQGGQDNVSGTNNTNPNGRDNASGNNNTNPNGQSNTIGNNKVVCFGNDFINKTFDVVYRVSPPIMSDWKDYFSERWEDAFGTKMDGRVTQIYDLLSDIITPREIIAFINEFVSIKQVADKSIPDEYIALFIKGRDKIFACPKDEILSPSFLGAMDFMYKNDPDLPKYISALYYQLPADDALDTVYTEDLKRALDNNDVNQIKTIQSNPKVFYSILENAITGITNIPNAVTALSQCLVDENSETAQRVWDCVYNREKMQEKKKSLQDYQKILIQYITNKDEYLQSLITAFCENQDIDVISYYNSIQQLAEVKDIDPFVYLIEKEVDAEQFIGFVEQAKETYKQFKIVCPQEKLNEYLISLDVDKLRTLSAIPILKNDYSLSDYTNQLNALIDSNINNKENVEILYERLKEVERPIMKKLPEHQLHQFFSNTKETDAFYYDLVCMRVSRLNNFPQNFQTVFNSVLNSTENGLVEKISERIEYYISYGDILLNVGNINYPLFNEIAKRLTEKSYGISKIDLVAILPQYDTIKSKLSFDNNVLLGRFNELFNENTPNITIDNVSTIPVNFFEDAIEIKNSLTIHCLKIAESYLNSKSKEKWKQSIVENDKDTKILIITKFDIQTCFEAFKELLVDKTNGKCDNLQKEVVDSFVKLSESNGRTLLNAFNDVRDCFCDKGCEMTVDLFDYFGEWLLKYARLEDKHSALRTIFKPAILDKESNIQLILKYQEKITKIVEAAREENKDFKDKIRSLLEGDYKDSDDFKKFAKTIGVKISIIDDITGKMKAN